MIIHNHQKAIFLIFHHSEILNQVFECHLLFVQVFVN